MAGPWEDFAPSEEQGPWSEFAQPAAAPKKVGVVEGGVRGVRGKFAAGMERMGNMAMLPVIGAEVLANQFRDKPDFGMTDYAASKFTTPWQQMSQADAIKKGEEMTLPGTIANVIGSLVGMFAGSPESLVPFGQATNLATKSATPLQQAGNIIGREFVQAQPMAQTNMIGRSNELQAQGVPKNIANAATLRSYGNVDAAGFAVPLSAAGGLLRRGLSGGGAMVATEVPSVAVENDTLTAYGQGDKAQDPFDPANLATSGGIGAMLAMMLGQRAPRMQTAESVQAGRNLDAQAQADLVQQSIVPDSGISIADLIQSQLLNEGLTDTRTTFPAPDQKTKARRKDAGVAFGNTPEGPLIHRRDSMDPVTGEMLPATEAGSGTLATNTDRLTGQRQAMNSEQMGGRPVDPETAAAYGEAGIDPNSVASAFERARMAPNTDPEVRSLKAEFGPDELGLIEKYTGMTAEDVAVLGPNSQRRVLARAMEAQQADTGRDTLVTSFGEQPLSSPASKPDVPGDRMPGRGEYEDKTARTGTEPNASPEVAKRAAAAKAKMLEKLDGLRQQKDAMDSNEARRELKRKADLGLSMTDKERKAHANFTAQREKLNQSIFDLEGKIYDTEARSELGSKTATGTSDRPFSSRPAEPGSFEEAARPAAEERARAEASRAEQEAIDRLEAEWRARNDARKQERAQNEAGQRKKADTAGNEYAGKKGSTNEAPLEGGKFKADANGFVMSDNGSPLQFGHQRDAGWWILKRGNKGNTGQVFEIHNHPSGKGYTVRVTQDNGGSNGGSRGSGRGEYRAQAEPAQRDSAEAQSPVLERPSADDIRARDDAARAADEQRRADERKSEVDAEPYVLTGSKRAVDQAEARGQRSLLDEPTPTRPGAGTLSANPFFDPAVWAQAAKHAGFALKTVAKALQDAYGWTERETGAFGRTLKELRKDFFDPDKVNRGSHQYGGFATRFYRAVFEDAGSTMMAKARATGSQTMQDLVKKFAHIAGDMTGQAETMPQRVEFEWNQQMSPVARALEKVEELAKTAGRDVDQVMEQVANLVRNPKGIRAGNPIHDAALAIRKQLDGTLKYLRESGVQMGEVKDGYFPREFDLDLAIKQPKQFTDALVQAYKENGIAEPEARKMADELFSGLVYGPESMFKADTGKPQADFMKGRVFAKGVDAATHPLHKFLVHDPRVVLSSYLMRAVKRAELARVFGETPERWAEMRSKMIDEGASPDAINDFADFVQTVGGMRGDKGMGREIMAATSWMRTMGTLMFLEKATLTSIPEMIMPAIRAGNILEAHRSIATTFKSLFMKTNGDIQKLTELADDIGLLSAHMSDTVMMNRWHGGDYASKIQTKIMDRHFKMTGLTQYTEATRMGALAVGQVFVRRLAKGVDGKLNRDYLGEVGIPADKVDAFAKWLTKTSDGMPSAADLRAAPPEMRKLYHTAMRKFEADSIMRPNMTTKPLWMSKPILGLLGQLQSYNYAFYSHVIKRVGKNAWKGMTDSNYSTLERMQLAKPLLMLPMLAAMQGLVGEARDALWGDPTKEQTGWQKVVRALDRGIPIAPISPAVNIVTGAKYQRSAVETAAGPVFGTGGRLVDVYVDYWFKNAAATNSQERAVGKNFYDSVMEPSLAVMLSYGYGNAGLPGKVGMAVARQAIGSGQTREAFVAGVAGEKDKNGPKDPSNPGEWMSQKLSDKNPSSSGGDSLAVGGF